MPRITLKDVAAYAGVSFQTVSKVLNGTATVAPETDARIRDAIDKLGYQPNVSAQNLRKRAINLIGYAWRRTLDGQPNPILDRFLYCAVQATEAEGFRLLNCMIGSADNSLDLTVYRDLIDRQQVDGFILDATNYDDPRIAYLIAQNIPFVSFGQSNDTWVHSWVDVDGRSGMCQVVEHLVARGHQRLALITWLEGSRSGNDRERGFWDGLRNSGLSFDPRWLYRGENSARTGAEAARHLLGMPDSERPTALVCVSDIIAVGALNAAAASGFCVGREIAITGFDDLPLVEYLHPPLTSVRQPIQAVAEQVVKMLVNQLNDPDYVHQGVLLQPELKVRESS